MLSDHNYFQPRGFSEDNSDIFSWNPSVHPRDLNLTKTSELLVAYE